MGMVIRRLDNRRLDAYVNGIRCLHGNYVLHKDDFGRGLLTAMHKGGTVGILMDTNMTPPQGAFVKFFGIEACTATGLAHVARKTGAAVLPASCFGTQATTATSSTSAPKSKSPTPATSKPTSSPEPSYAQPPSNPGSGAILTSGSGFTAAGKPAPPASRGFIEIMCDLHTRLKTGFTWSGLY